MKKTFSKCTVAITTSALNLAFVVPSFAGVIPPTSTYAGKTLYQWSAEWWKTFFEADATGNPLYSDDPDGIGLEAINDPLSPVFFLTGQLSSVDLSGVSVNRSVTIPEKQAIFFPMVNAFGVLTEPTDTAQSLCDFSKSSIDSVTNLFTTLDGVEIGGNSNQLLSQRQSCNGQTNLVSFPGQDGNFGTFGVDAPPNSLLGALGNQFNVTQLLPTNNLTISDGYWLLLTPLKPGKYTLNFGATGPGTTQANTYEITIVPVPEPSFIVGFFSLGTLGAASTLKRKLKPSKSSEKETTKVS